MKLLIVSDFHTDVIFDEALSAKLLSGEVELSMDTFRLGTPQLGGVGANTARASSMLGLNTALLAVSGTDLFTEDRLHALKACGIDTSLIIQDPRPSMTIPVAVSGGERIFLRPLQLDGLSDHKLEIKDIHREALERYDLFYTTGLQILSEPMRTSVMTVARWFYEAHKPIIFDCNLRRQMFGLNDQNIKDYYEMFSMCHTVSGSGDEELCYITGKKTIREACEEILSAGSTNVIAKLGAEGSALYDGKQVLRCPALPVPVRDTLGAGDTFAGGYLAGLAEGLSMEGYLRKAALAAAYEIQYEGTGTMGTTNQLEELDRKYGPLKITASDSQAQ